MIPCALLPFVFGKTVGEKMAMSETVILAPAEKEVIEPVNVPEGIKRLSADPNA